MPKEARVTYTDGDIFSEVDRVIGHGTHANLPAKYTRNVNRSALFNPSITWDIHELTRWLKRHSIEMVAHPASIYEHYLAKSYVIFTTVIQHPAVPNPELYVICDIVFQRAVIVYDPEKKTERLFLQSSFHSRQLDDKHFVNFVPHGGIEMSFASETIWYPLELSTTIFEPATYVVLDILTTKPLTSALPKPFQLEKKGQMTYQNENYEVARITAKLEVTPPEFSDLMLT